MKIGCLRQRSMIVRRALATLRPTAARPAVLSVEVTPPVCCHCGRLTEFVAANVSLSFKASTAAGNVYRAITDPKYPGFESITRKVKAA